MATERVVKGSHYALAYVWLIALATASLLLSFLKLHWAQLPVALGIAAIKALIVLFIFMHLIEERFSTRFVVVVAASFFVLLVGLAATDVATRHTFPPRPSPTRSHSFYKR